MKLALAIVAGFICSSPVFAQYSATTLTRRIAPQLGRAPAPARPAPVQPNAVAQQSLASPAPTQADKDEADKKLLAYQQSRANAGSDNAQYELGLRYLTGKGVVKNEVEAKQWLEKSAKQGNTQAVKKLGELSKTVATASVTPAQPLAKK